MQVLQLTSVGSHMFLGVPVFLRSCNQPRKEAPLRRCDPRLKKLTSTTQNKPSDLQPRNAESTTPKPIDQCKLNTHPGHRVLQSPAETSRISCKVLEACSLVCGRRSSSERCASLSKPRPRRYPEFDQLQTDSQTDFGTENRNFNKTEIDQLGVSKALYF